MRLLAALALLAPAWGAGPPLSASAAQRRSVAAMEASLARQRMAAAAMRASVLGQRSTATPVSAASPLAQPSIPAPAPGACEPLAESRLADLVQQAGEREGLAARLLRAVIEKESSAMPCAVSSKGALGLMQLMPAAISDLEVANPFDPKQNVDAGAKLLKQLLVRYGGDVALALGAYNAGPARVDEAGGVPRIEETMEYVNHILTRIGAPGEDVSR